MITITIDDRVINRQLGTVFDFHFSTDSPLQTFKFCVGYIFASLFVKSKQKHLSNLMTSSNA